MTSPPMIRPPSRRGAFIIATLIFPIAFFIIVECVLRLSHYGPNIDLFTTVTVQGKPYRVMNPQVKNRYFSQVWFNPSTAPDLFAIPKPPGTFRIFCLGGSTTVGYPYWYNGAFASFLRSRLTLLFPHRQFEVINVGMTATNSFTALDMASDILSEEPDLLIVYDGHNEFYGALGVASRENWGGPRWMTRLALRLVRLKTVYLLRDAIVELRGLFGSSREEPSGTMMEQLALGKYVPYRSELYEKALSEFTENVKDLKRICVEKRVPLILSTQVSNLRDLAPFVSGNAPGATAAIQTSFNRLFNAAMTMEMEGEPDSAVILYREAEALDPHRAETCFDLARCLELVGDQRKAREEYIKARDYDQLRFRASSDFNDAIRQIADGRSVLLADVEHVFMGDSPDSLVGSALLFEHVHPRSAGASLMAKEYAELMRKNGMLASPGEWQTADTLQDATVWDARPVTTFDEAIANRRTEILLSGWPFQPVGRTPHPVRPEDYLGSLADSVVYGAIGWDEGHRKAAAYLESRGDTAKAGAEYRVLFQQFAHLKDPNNAAASVENLSYSSAKHSYELLRNSH